jgi:hypothetical protein
MKSGTSGTKRVDGGPDREKETRRVVSAWNRCVFSFDPVSLPGDGYRNLINTIVRIGARRTAGGLLEALSMPERVVSVLRLGAELNRELGNTHQTPILAVRVESTVSAGALGPRSAPALNPGPVAVDNSPRMAVDNSLAEGHDPFLSGQAE